MNQSSRDSAGGGAEHSVIRDWGLVLGPLLALAVYLLSQSQLALPGSGVMELEPAAGKTAAIMVWMAIWWMTEALPLPATSLMPLVLFPLLGVFEGSSKEVFQQAATPYANRFVFLLMGGFMIALAIERWGLHRRIALLTVWYVGVRPRRLVAGFMIATAGLSMWISNTATTAMMLPIAISLINLLYHRFELGSPATGDSPPGAMSPEKIGLRDDVNRFATCLMLSVAYAASIGGMMTFVGTIPNAFMAEQLDEIGLSISFGRWMVFTAPLVVAMLFISWVCMTRFIFPFQFKEIPGGKAMIGEEIEQLGPMNRGERIVLLVFVLTAILWVLRAPLQDWQWLTDRVPVVSRLSDTVIALMGALSLFVIPVHWQRREFALNWEVAARLPWGVLLLFGGGLSLAAAVASSGLAEAIAQAVTLVPSTSELLPMLIVAAVIILLTEVTSNTATVTIMVPLLVGIAGTLVASGDSRLLVIPATLAASCAFMLPVATPPNAIVFASERIKIRDMAYAGMWLNLVGLILIPLVVLTWGRWILGIGQ
jgi:sodium-dependent dicarboxylate transporter 2/3/5